jgi:hypothetical protein
VGFPVDPVGAAPFGGYRVVSGAHSGRMRRSGGTTLAGSQLCCVLVLACLPVPAMAGSGLSIPLPSVVYRLAVSVAEGAAEVSGRSANRELAAAPQRELVVLSAAERPASESRRFASGRSEVARASIAPSQRTREGPEKHASVDPKKVGVHAVASHAGGVLQLAVDAGTLAPGEPAADAVAPQDGFAKPKPKSESESKPKGESKHGSDSNPESARGDTPSKEEAKATQKPAKGHKSTDKPKREEATERAVANGKAEPRSPGSTTSESAVSGSPEAQSGAAQGSAGKHGKGEAKAAAPEAPTKDGKRSKSPLPAVVSVSANGSPPPTAVSVTTAGSLSPARPEQEKPSKEKGK